MEKTEETVTCPKGAGDLLAGLGTVHATAFARVRDGIPPDDTDDVRRKVTSNDETIVFEAKSAAPAKIPRDRGIGRFFSAPPSKRKRACHPDSIVVRTEAGATRVCIYGICPKCGTGSGYLDVPAEHVHNTSGPHTSSLTVDKCSIDTTCALETCEHQYRVHV